MIHFGVDILGVEQEEVSSMLGESSVIEKFARAGVKSEKVSSCDVYKRSNDAYVLAGGSGYMLISKGRDGSKSVSVDVFVYDPLYEKAIRDGAMNLLDFECKERSRFTRVRCAKDEMIAGSYCGM